MNEEVIIETYATEYKYIVEFIVNAANKHKLFLNATLNNRDPYKSFIFSDVENEQRPLEIFWKRGDYLTFWHTIENARKLWHELQERSDFIKV
jgi:hypothetical protein